MAKLRNSPTVVSDLLEYIETSSDFAFELRVLQLLNNFGISCEHGGSYEDPVTKKTREFDIRATATSKSKTVRLAIECKNVRDNFPILVSRVPRHKDESYHQIAIMQEPEVRVGNFVSRSPTTPRAEILSIRNNYSLYKTGQPVGKSTAQVGRAPDKDATLVVADSELYEKWGQALSSLTALVERMYWDNEEEVMYGCAVPLVVVPDGRLWAVDYSADGSRKGAPKEIDHCSCFVDKAYEMGNGVARAWYHVSHIEILTFGGLEKFVKGVLYQEDGLVSFFPPDGINAAWERLEKS